MRRPAFRKRAPLLDPESVLLVDDGDGEVAQLDALLDQRVRADDDVRGRRQSALPLRRRARQESASHSELAAERLDRQEVLLGERLGGRHQRALTALLDGAQERVQRDNRLPGADVALQEPLHRHAAGEIGVELADRLLLVRSERERQRLPVADDQISRLAERRGDRRLPLAGASRQHHLQQ